MIEAWLGTTVPVYIVITLIITGFTAFMTGQAIASTWRPQWQLFVYCALLGGASRFLIFGLFQGALFSVSGYLTDVTCLILIAQFAFRTTRARRMVTQYPWLYERAGLFGWRSRQ